MKTKKFENALTNIDDKYIQEAISYRKSPTSLKVWRSIAIAACACLAAGASILAIQSLTNGRAYKNTAYDEAYYNNDNGSNAVLYNSVEEAAYDGSAYENSTAAYDSAYNDSASAYDSAYESVYAAGAGAESANRSLDASDTSNLTENGAKIIYTASITMQSTEFDSAISEIEAITEKLNGYFEYQDIEGQSDNYRNAYFTIRIPVENLEDFLNQSSEICTVISLNKSATDISDSYYDTDARLTTAKTKLARLQELLADAESMDDIITIEEAISDTEWEIDNLSGTLKIYDSQINYSTVTIYLSEVYKVDSEKAPLTFSEKISKSFSNGLTTFGNFIESLILWFAGRWLWLVILAVIVIAAAFIIKGIRKHNKCKNINNNDNDIQ